MYVSVVDGGVEEETLGKTTPRGLNVPVRSYVMIMPYVVWTVTDPVAEKENVPQR
jgi:hypothetical protein